MTPARATGASPRAGRLMVGAGVLVTAHLAFRAWAVYPAFFYGDDYRLVREAGREPLTLDLLLSPYEAQFMPFGRFVAWIGSLPDHLSWPLLASTSLVMQAVAALSCLWMLVTLFGWRRRVLALLAFYLSCAMTMPAFMWWAAALNQVPLQAVFFGAVAIWVRYLRTPRLRWLILLMLVLAFGLCCYVKALLVFPVLAFLALAYFTQGGPVARISHALRRYWPAAATGLVGAAAFLVYYVTTVPQLAGRRPTGAAELADEMVGTSFAAAVLGGPWRWDLTDPPVGRADPPELLVHLCWVVMALTLTYLALRRERTLRAWLFLTAYVGADFLLLFMTRAAAFGSVSGTEYRYLTDAMCAVVLALGLATMELRGAPESSRERSEPLLTRPVGTPVVAALSVLVIGSGLWSSAAYARIWHEKHPGKQFYSRTLADLEAMDGSRADLANQFLPNEVTGAFGPPYSRTDVILPLLTSKVAFPAMTDRLHALDSRGAVVPAPLEGERATPPGPVPGCGWRVTSAPLPEALPLDGPTIALDWWLRIDYLASGDTGMELRAGTSVLDANLRRGLNQLYLRADGAFEQVHLGGLDPGVTVCVDKITVGRLASAAVEEDR